jgi:hypothetical protein
MRAILILALLPSSSLFAQPETDHVFVHAIAGVAGGGIMSTAPVQGAPYSATITNQSIQTLADGNRIVQSSTGTTARDSMGRTRQDTPLPAIGNMLPADAPHLVIIQDPVAQTSYTLNLSEKTAMKGGNVMFNTRVSGPGPAGAGIAISGSAVRIKGVTSATTTVAHMPQVMTFQKAMIAEDPGQAQNEDLGSKVIEGVTVNGKRTTLTIPAGQIGNDRPLSIVTEVWTSPELKTVVYSKRSDPRMGDQIFELTNISRAEPDASQFMVPADFKTIDGAEPIFYETHGGAN